MTRAQTPRAAANAVTTNVLVFALAWAAAQPLLCAVPPGLLVAWVGNGLVFGVYAAMLFGLRGGAANIVRATLLAGVGATHFAWVLPVGSLADTVIRSMGLTSDSGMWIATAVVLGVGVALATMRWWIALLPLASLGAAIAIDHIAPIGIVRLLSFGTRVGAIHVGLLAGVAFDTRRFLKSRWPEGGCAHCGYDLRGLNATQCPECGQPTASSAVA